MSLYGQDDFIAVSAVRYAIGRQTYIVDETCRWLRDAWPVLNPKAQSLIRRDITEAIERDNRVRETYGPNKTFKPLGADCDRQAWVAVCALWAQDRAP